MGEQGDDYRGGDADEFLGVRGVELYTLGKCKRWIY